MDPVWHRELAEFIRIPSVSADPAHEADVVAAAEWVAAFVRRAGGTAELVPWGERPLVVGDLPASNGAREAPTVLLYGHFDVQPPAPLDHWESDPFELSVRGEWAYGRGIADDKGQLYALLKAGQELAREGRLPVNLRVACDGEEEVGGHSVVEYLERDERGADACVIFDSAMIRRGVPAFNLATRGLIYFHLALRTGSRDLHSGLYGGAALNAATALMQTLAAVRPQNGRLPEGLRKGIVPPTEEELDSWRELPPGTEELADQGARPADPAAADEFYLRVFAEPALDVNGIETGSPHLQKTVLPVLAEANVSIRLAPLQEPNEIEDELERLLREAAPDGADLEIERLSSAPPGLVSPDTTAVQLGLEAFERALGTRPLLVRSGGTLPIVPALAERGIPTIVTGFAVPDSNIHSPNERLLVESVPLAVRAASELFVSFARL
ncbi:MAG TPA: M20/M25/M40 family metallo-hydrolase [Gaiellaceae bacterium]|nr:M20/M25/M40 family metallo-hydrolase [Gaiellaceae bacterium]